MANLTIQDALPHHQAGDIQKARAIYNELLANEPNNVDALQLLGILEAQEQNFGAALKLLERATTNNPNLPALHNNLGNVLKKLGKFDKAKQQYIKALELDPDSATAHNNLANILIKQNLTEEATRHYREAIRIRPEYTDAHYNLGLVLAKQEKTQETREHLEAILRWDPNNISALHNLGAILAEQGNFDAAVTYLKKVLEQEPQHIETLKNLGAVYLKQKQSELALQCYLRLLPVTTDFDVYYNIGIIYLEQNRYRDAEQYFQQALAIKPNDFATLNNLGAICLKIEDHPQAIKYYQAALQVEPDNEEIRYLLAALTETDNYNAMEAAPKEYVQNLFNQYAPYYDKHLTKFLNYKVPELLYAALVKELDKSTANLTILDLGCGTGLGGEKLRPLAAKLIGVDLAPEMLKVAQEKAIYDELQPKDITAAASEYNNNVDIIIAADTLVYLGDLDQIFANCHVALTNNGLFAFTIENTATYPYVLQKNARFAHSQQYIHELANKYHFSIAKECEITLRKQKNVPVLGLLYILKSLKIK